MNAWIRPGWRLLAAMLLAASLPASAASDSGDGDGDGPYVRYVDQGVEARWICGRQVQVQSVVVKQWPVRLAPGCGFSSALVLRGPAALDGPARVMGAARLVALSDTHGQYALMKRLLQAHGVINAQGEWAYGSGHLVMTGDVFDRGPQVNEILWFLYMLEQQARDAGGAVHFLLGNHESMVLRGDLRYVHEKYQRNALLLGTTYPALYGPDTVLGDWLRSKRTVLLVDDLLFMHGGLSPAQMARGWSLEDINRHSRASLGLSRDQFGRHPDLAAMQDGTDSPIWYRGYFTDADMTPARVKALLEPLGAERIVVGHTSQPNVQWRLDGRVIAIDSSIKEGVSGELLFREDGVLSRGLLDGSRLPLGPVLPP